MSLHAIEQTQLRRRHRVDAWGARNLISTQVNVARGSTVADLKAAIATALADAPAERQRLIFGGKPLADGSLAASGLADGQTVHLALRPSSS